jgi:CMP-N-acetylneuraminic acid synthetase
MGAEAIPKQVLGVIPARGGSKSVHRKNLRELAGKPLIQSIFESAQEAKHLNRVILSTEDEEIAAVGRSIGIEVPFMRPTELATDDATLISVVKHALAQVDSQGASVDAVMSLQPTCPFLSAETIDRAIALWAETGCDSVTTVAELTKGHPYITKRLHPNHAIENFCQIPAGIDNTRRQAREKAYYLTGGLYLRGRAFIESEATDSHFLGEDSRGVVVNEMEAIDINSDFDFRLAEWIIREWGVGS